MIPSTIFFFVCWIALFFIFSGIGLTARRWIGSAPPVRIEGLFSCFWVGLALSTFFVQLWHFFFPVNTGAFIAVMIWGGSGFWLHARHMRRAPVLSKKQKKALGKNKAPRLSWAFYLPAIGMAWFIAFYASGLPAFYDAGLYYLPTIRWITSFPAIPGLANLHARLAFNQTYFLYVALLDAWTGRGSHLANSTLILFSLLQFWISFLRVLRPVDRRRPVDIFQTLMIPFVAHQVFLIFLASPTPDLGVMVITVHVTSFLLRLLDNHEDTAPQTSWLIYGLAVLILFGITTKITFLIYGGLAFLVLLITMWRSRQAILVGNISRLIWGIILTALLTLVPWLVHGAIMTGWIAYPLAFGSFDVDWRLPTASLEHMRTSVVEYAHKDWSKRPDKLIFAGMPLALAGLGMIANIIAFFRKNTIKTKPAMWLLLVPCVLALIQWRIQVPNLRFGYAFFSILPAAILTLWLRGIKNPVKIIIIYLVIFGGALVYEDVANKRSSRTVRRNRILTRKLQNVWRADKASWLTEQTYLPFITHSKLMIFVPMKDDRCWDTDQICTPYPRRDLKLRKAPDVRHGFRMEPFNESDPFVGFRGDKNIKPSLDEIPD